WAGASPPPPASSAAASSCQRRIARRATASRYACRGRRRRARCGSRGRGRPGCRGRARWPRAHRDPMRDRYPNAATLAALLCLAAACADARAPGDPAQRGAAHQPAWPPGQEWRIEPEPVFVIGAPGAGDGIELYGVATALLLADGRIAVAERSSQRIRLFDPTGRQELPALGGRGRGPGEFTGLFWIGVFRGDSILAWDSGQARATVFAPGGEYVRTISLPSVDGFFIAIADHVFPDGSLLLRAG